MARTLNPTVYAVRRDAFVDAAQRLIQAKGYEQMSIQDVLDEVDASRGAFYHYFDSKADLLEAVVTRLTDAAMLALAPIIDDPNLTAVAKLDGFFTGLGRWKGERTELLRGFMDTWFADDNAIVREKFRHGIAQRLTPVLARIVAQGRDEGWPTTGDSHHIARVLVSLIQGANEAATELFYARRAGTIAFEEVEPRLAAYWRAMERILGLPTGSFTVIDRAILHEWFG
jgi:AcrR family transcriptional regulator